MYSIHNVTVNIIDDTTMEAPEDFFMTLTRSSFPGLRFDIAPANAIITIIDNDGQLHYIMISNI